MSTRYLQHRKLTTLRRYVTPDPPAGSTVGAPPFVLQDARVPAASLSNNAAQIASVSSPRAPTPSVAYSHGAVPAKGISVDSAVPLSPGTTSTKGTRASCAVPIGHGPSWRREPVLTAPFPSAAAQIRRRGDAFQTPSPSTMARAPALHAPIPSATRRAAMRVLQRRVALLSERVHPLLVLIRWWRSV